MLGKTIFEYLSTPRGFHFLPVKSKKGKPREKGQTQSKRTWYEVVKKKKKLPV
jgi:hypothetical protein